LSCVLPLKANSLPASVLTWKWRMVRLRIQDAVSIPLFFLYTGLRPITGSWHFLHGVAATVLYLIVSASPS
jgi:hypothetical protein